MAKKILIIEDDHDFAKSLVLALSLKHIEADTAGSGSEGVEMFLRGDYGLSITDIKLPDFNGIEVIRRLKAERSDAQVLVMTGFRDPELLQQAWEEGASEVLLKPFRMHDFIDKIQTLSH